MMRKSIAAALLCGITSFSAANHALSQEAMNGTVGNRPEQFAPQELRQAPPPFDRDAGREPSPSHDFRPPFDPSFDLARELSAAEIYIAVTPEQLQAWRGYTAALIALVDASKPDFARKEPPAFGADRTSVANHQRLGAEILADRALVIGEKARALKDELNALTAILSADQIERLSQAERNMRLAPPPPMDL